MEAGPIMSVFFLKIYAKGALSGWYKSGVQGITGDVISGFNCYHPFNVVESILISDENF